jgi:hypothetical protein
MIQEVVQLCGAAVRLVMLPRQCNTGHAQNMTHVSFHWCSSHTVHEWQTAGFCSIERCMPYMLDFNSGVYHINDVLAGGSSPVIR